MDTTRITRGDDLMLFNSDKESIAFATNHTLTLTGDAVEISCKDSGIWKDSIVNKLGWEISSENLYCDTEYEKVFELWMRRDPIDVYFGKRSGLPFIDDTGSDPSEGSSPSVSKGCTPNTFYRLQYIIDNPSGFFLSNGTCWCCADGKTFWVQAIGGDKYMKANGDSATGKFGGPDGFAGWNSTPSFETLSIVGYDGSITPAGGGSSPSGGGSHPDTGGGGDIVYPSSITPEELLPNMFVKLSTIDTPTNKPNFESNIVWVCEDLKTFYCTFSGGGVGYIDMNCKVLQEKGSGAPPKFGSFGSTPDPDIIPVLHVPQNRQAPKMMSMSVMSVKDAPVNSIEDMLVSESPNTEADINHLYSGKAVITNLSINAASGDNATYSITLQGVGEFSKVK